MAEHFRHIFELYIVSKCNCRSKGVAGNVHRQLLLYPTEVSNLLQVGVHLLVGIDGQKRASLLAQWVILVFFEYLQRVFEQGHIELHIGLLTLLAYPLATVGVLGDILGAEVVHIDIRQPRVTTEQEYLAPFRVVESKIPSHAGGLPRA